MKLSNLFKELFAAIILLLAFMPVGAQRQYNVLDWKSDVSLNTWLVQDMHRQYELRRVEFQKALASKNAARAYVISVQKKYRQILGEFPVKSGLNARVTGTITQPGYTIEKIVYESFPGHHVTANLYLPQGKGPFPAALLFCGHEDVSKATESYQRTAVLFARNGFVVFVIDPISQSERHQLTDENGKPLTRGGTTEHTLLNGGSNLVGTSTPADELWDNVRGLDYLVTRKEVDTARIGCLGNSGGGMQTIYFAGYEPRIKVMAACSFLMTRERTLELTGASDGCSHIPGEGRMGLEMNDFLIAAAPKPVLVLAGRFDFIDYTGTVAAYNELKKLYTVLGQAEKVKLFTVDDGHGISKPKREEAVTWFRKWLYKDNHPVVESDIPVLSDKDLFSTNAGMVNKEFKEEQTIPQRNLDLYERYADERKKFLQLEPAELRIRMAKLLAIETKFTSLDVEKTGALSANGTVMEKIILRRPNAVPMPLLMSAPSHPKKILIYVDERGKGKLADSLGFVRQWVDAQYLVVLADLRGMGETMDRVDQNDPKYMNAEYRNAMLALHIGKPLPGQRTEDLLALIQFFSSDSKWKDLPIVIYARGNANVPAVYASLFHKSLTYVDQPLEQLSYKKLLGQPLSKDAYSIIIPDALKYFDLPDLIQLAGGRIRYLEKILIDE